jgi:Protein of unknown function (DUF4238)
MSQPKSNQHYVPQSLIKQFSIREKKKQVYWYRGEKTTINPVGEVFAEKYYYGRKESNDFADGVITDGENVFVNKLLLYLTEQEGVIADSHMILIPDFIAHFLLRRSLNRNLFLRTAEDYDTSGIDISFIDDTLKSFENNPLKIRVIQQEYLLRIMLAPFVFKYLVDVLKAFMPESLRNSLTNDQTQKAFKDECKGIHNRTIIAKENHKTISQFLARFEYTVIKSNISLILGDTICFFEHDDGTFSPFDFKPVKNIFMPISSNKILVGFRKGIYPQINFHQINYHNACCCSDSFVHSMKSNEIQNLVNFIARAFQPLQKKMAKNNISIIRDLLLLQFNNCLDDELLNKSINEHFAVIRSIESSDD